LLAWAEIFPFDVFDTRHVLASLVAPPCTLIFDCWKFLWRYYR
jgi:hypothetical protein